MIRINNTYIPASVQEIVSLLKTHLTLKGMNLLQQVKQGRDNIQITCPFHANGQERRPSCGIRTTEEQGKEVGSVHCFTDDTKVITFDGTKRIKDIVGKKVFVLNGNGFWEQTIFKSYGIQELYKLTLRRDGHYKIIYTTSDHLWKVRSRKNFIPTKELIKNQRLEKAIPNNISLNIIDEGIIHGFIFGDGSINRVYKDGTFKYRVHFFTNDKMNVCNKFFKNFEGGEGYKNYPYPYKFVSSSINYKSLPITNNLDYLYSFIVGWFAADGCVSQNGVCSISNKDEKNIDFLVDTLPKLGIAHFGKRFQKREPNDTYIDKESIIWKLTFAVNTLPNNFFVRYSESPINRVKQYDRLKWTVQKVEKTNTKQEVFCCETKSHTFTLEDFILTHNCFTCGYKASLPIFISNCFGFNDLGKYGQKWLLKHFGGFEDTSYRKLNLNFDRTCVQVDSKQDYVSEEELESYRYTHPYMYQRGLTDEIIEKYDIGYDKNSDCITMPIRDDKGRTLFFCRRSVKTKFFNYPSGVEKPIYGIYELPKDCKEIVVCESVFNALTCVKYGKPAIALLGLGTHEQLIQLNKLPTRLFILATDKDDAGKNARIKIRKYLKNKIVREFDYSSYPQHCNDINDMTEEEFNNLRII